MQLRFIYFAPQTKFETTIYLKKHPVSKVAEKAIVSLEFFRRLRNVYMSIRVQSQEQAHWSGHWARSVLDRIHSVPGLVELALNLALVPYLANQASA
jgi:hypothetical protein